MKRFVHSLISVIIVILLIFGVSMSVFGAASASVKMDSIKAEAGQKVSMPVYIKNNPGFCGMKITINYDKSLEVISVEKGSVFTYGNFIQNAAYSKNNSFDVVWNSSTENKANGVMFTVTFKLPDAAAGDYNIKISYDKDNTFNAKYEDVTFNCGDAVISTPQKEITDETISIYKKIVDFFKKIIDFIRSLFK